MAIDSGNLFDPMPDATGGEIFTDLVRGKSVRIETIVSRGQSSPASGWYDQAEHEWVVVLHGEAKIAFENGGAAHLVAGSYLNIPAHTRHRVAWTAADTDTVWLAVFYR